MHLSTESACGAKPKVSVPASENPKRVANPKPEDKVNDSHFHQFVVAASTNGLTFQPSSEHSELSKLLQTLLCRNYSGLHMFGPFLLSALFRKKKKKMHVKLKGFLLLSMWQAFKPPVTLHAYF